jgi:hypothetical protein
MYYGNLPKPALPVITMNGNPIPAPQPTGALTGWQLIIIDASKDYTNPGSILFNSYISLYGGQTNSWMNTYQYMYSRMCWDVFNSGNIDQQLLIVVSYGLDNNMPPTNDGYEMLLGAGAGEQLQYWQTHCDPGSQVGNVNSWVSFPANYILVGFSALTYNQGNELYQSGGQGPVTSKLSVTLQNNVAAPTK